LETVTRKTAFHLVNGDISLVAAEIVLAFTIPVPARQAVIMKGA
jgi:hypothetical protein